MFACVFVGVVINTEQVIILDSGQKTHSMFSLGLSNLTITSTKFTF